MLRPRRAGTLLVITLGHIFAVRPRRCLAALALALACGHEELPFTVPGAVEASRYVEYGTWADDTAVCMGPALARLDDHVEATAEFMAVSLPTSKIRYTWVPPELEGEDTWFCTGSPQACHIGHNGRSYIFTTVLEQFHEVVHAVDYQALGEGHRVLTEGIAVYLGRDESYKTERFLKNFPAAFRDVVESDGPIDYERSLHFVGSILERDGVEKFKELRARVPVDADYAAFAAAYLAVYGQDLDAALAEMTTPIRPWFAEYDPCVGEPIPWGAGPELEVKLRGRCGDGSFFGGGLVDDDPGFSKVFTIDIPAAGMYTMSVTGNTSNGKQLIGELSSCSDTEGSGVRSVWGSPGTGTLRPGRHRLAVGFPHAAEPAGELDLSLRYVAAP